MVGWEGNGVADLTPAQLLAATAADMRQVADACTPGPWRYNPAKAWHSPQDLPLRRHGEEFVGAGPLDATIGVASTGPADEPQGMADALHIAAWDPDMARAVAAWLETPAAKYGGGAAALEVCRAWWASRGVEPITSQ